MNITTQESWELQPTTLPIADYVEVRCRGNRHDGQIESLEERISNLTGVVGRLLNHLATHNMISAPTVTSIVQNYIDDKAKFTED